mmetsp:Transcript_20247/g.43855  ORF Transcript_20247/g.43855 Transcript_20247/m.43855 type:complete len:206 (-) Transcript_20247:59-676(-)
MLQHSGLLTYVLVALQDLSSRLQALEFQTKAQEAKDRLTISELRNGKEHSEMRLERLTTMAKSRVAQIDAERSQRELQRRIDLSPNRRCLDIILLARRHDSQTDSPSFRSHTRDSSHASPPARRDLPQTLQQSPVVSPPASFHSRLRASSPSLQQRRSPSRVCMSQPVVVRGSRAIHYLYPENTGRPKSLVVPIQGATPVASEQR